MKICVISSTVFPAGMNGQGIIGYGGLEQIAWQIADGLVKKGHQVTFISPEGSRLDGGEVICPGPPGGIDERRAYQKYWKELVKFDCISDHSVAGDETLLVRIDGKPRWLSFEELFNWSMERSHVMMDGESVEIPVMGLEVPSAVNQFKIRWKPVTAIIRHKRKDAIHSIKIRGNHVVNVTAGHSMMVASSNGLDSCRADESVMRSAAMAGRIPASNLDAQFWPVSKSVLNGLSLKWDGMADHVEKFRNVLFERLVNSGVKPASAKTNIYWWKKRSVPFDQLPITPDEFSVVGRKGNWKWPVKLTDDDLVLFGLWLGDGCYDGDAGVLLASGIKTKHVGNRVASKFSAACKIDKAWPKIKFRINSHVLVKLMRSVGFVGDSYTKRVPDWIFGLSRRQIGLFLKGYFSADGCMSSRLSVGSVNKVLIDQTCVLLALCGIKTNRESGVSKTEWSVGNRHYQATVPADNFNRFLKYVGFVQEWKNERVRKKILTRRSKRGEVPRCLIRQRSMVRSDMKKSREAVISISRLERLRGSAIADQYAKSPVCWREIVESTATDRKDEYVYDLSVPGTENFFVGLICCHNSWSKWSYILKKEGTLTAPVLGTIHAPANTMYQTPPPVDKPCIVAISRDQASHWEALHSDVKAKVAYNGIDLNHYKAMNIPRTNRFLFLARFSSIKGPQLAVKAARQAQVGLDLVGDTSITQEPQLFQEINAACDGTQIKMIGPSTRGNTVWWFSQAHAMMHPNQLFREPFGLAPVEAQACGCPVIAWRKGALPETVIDGETGHLCSNIEEYVAAVNKVKSMTAAEMAVMRNRCRENASMFSVQKMIDSYDRLCHEAVETGGW